MELIAPWNKESLFLTVTEYNDSYEPILAVASVEKDQPFFNTAGGGVYIAAESFRISAFAKDLGYIYQMLKPNWFISGHRRVGDADESDEKVTTILQTNDVVVQEGSLYKMRIKLKPDLSDESSLRTLQTSLAGDLNDYRVHKNSIVSITPDQSVASETRYFKILNEPGETMQAQGMGSRGLVDVPFEIIDVITLGEDNETQVHLDINGNPLNFCVAILVEKKDIPAETTLDSIKRYFSQGLYCYANQSRNELDWAYNGNYVLKILGAYRMLVRDVDGVDEKDISDIEKGGQPQVRLWTNRDKFFEPAVEVHLSHADYVTHGMISSTHFHQWAYEDSTSFGFRLSVAFNEEPNSNAKLLETLALANDNQGMGTIQIKALDQMQCFAYGFDTPVIDSLNCIADCELLVGAPLDVSDDQAPIPINLIQKRSVAYEGTIARTVSNTNYPALSPNEMFQIYNGLDESGEPLWLLNGHINGGFKIEIKQDLDTLRVSKEFFDELGLDPRVLSYESVSEEDKHSVGVLLVPTLQPDEEGTAIDRPQEHSNFSNWVTEADVSQCTLWDGSMIDSSSGALDQLVGQVVRVIGLEESVSYFRLMNHYRKHRAGGKLRKMFLKDSRIEDGDDGPEYVFSNVSAGDVIQNLQYVSVESFSMFEAIQLCASVPFQPMITSYSSGMRVLAELRLSFPVGPQPGPTGKNQGTNDFWIGDIQWNASNGHQYLQLSTAQQSIYQLEIRAQFVYRNANALPPKPIWIAPRGGLFQTKIRLVSVK